MSSTAKTAYVETGITIAAPVFSVLSQDHITAPQSLTLTKVASSTEEGVYRGILVSWSQPSFGAAVSYAVHWRKDNGNYTVVENLTGQTYEIPTTTAGTYDVLVYATGITNAKSPAASATTTINLDSGVGSLLNPVTGLTVIGGGTSFVGSDLNVVFTNPSSNENIAAVLKDFEVKVYDTTTLLRTEYIGAGTLPGGTVNYFYDFTKNVADGGPRRTVRLVVSARDTNNKVSTGTDVTFTNPAPAVLSNVSVVAGMGGLKITYTLPTDTDFAGVLIWVSTTTGFTPDASNLVYDGSDNYVALTALAAAQTVYVKLAAYDTFFARNYTGAGLNLTGQFSATPATVEAGMPRYATAPTGVEGDVYYNTTDDHLYQHNGTTWVLVSSDIVADTITGAMIKANTVSAYNIVANTITAGEIASNTITADRLVTGTITANEIASGTITADRLSVAALDVSGNLNAAAGTFGAVTVAAGGNVKMGQSAFNSGTGFFLGDSGGTPKFSIGNSSGNRMTWDGASLQWYGTINDDTRAVLTGTTYVLDANNVELLDTTYYSVKTKIRDLVIKHNGTISIRTTYASYAASTLFYLYKNGDQTVAIDSWTGTTLTTRTTANVTVKKGDSLELWVTKSGAASMFVHGFQATTSAVGASQTAKSLYDSATYTAGTTNVVIYNNTMESRVGLTLASGDYRVVKQVQVVRSGTVTVNYTYWSGSGASITFGLFKNHVLQGSGFATTTTTRAQTANANITVNEGDFIQVKAICSSASVVAWSDKLIVMSANIGGEGIII